MRLFAFISFLLMIPSALSGQDISSQVAASVKAGNSKELSKHFAASIDLTVLEKEEVYSKTQAEIILKDFFSKNVPRSFEIVHSGTSKLGMQYSIGNLVTDSGKFRVSFYLKKSGESQVIQQFRIDAE